MSATPQRRIELHRPREAGWQELWLKEDWWAVWLGLGLEVRSGHLFLFAGWPVRGGTFHDYSRMRLVYCESAPSGPFFCQ